MCASVLKSTKRVLLYFGEDVKRFKALLEWHGFLLGRRKSHFFCLILDLAYERHP